MAATSDANLLNPASVTVTGNGAVSVVYVTPVGTVSGIASTTSTTELLAVSFIIAPTGNTRTRVLFSVAITEPSSFFVVH